MFLNKLNDFRNEVNGLEVGLRETDNEVKLCEMKIKELRKRIPHLKLVPLPPQIKKENHSYSCFHAATDTRNKVSILSGPNLHQVRSDLLKSNREDSGRRQA